jgi:hypothetical protein
LRKSSMLSFTETMFPETKHSITALSVISSQYFY